MSIFTFINESADKPGPKPSKSEQQWVEIGVEFYTAKEKGDENMIRIEILFDRQSTKNLKSGTLQALQNEIEQRLKPHYPEIWLRIDQGSAPSVSVTGARNDKDKERILSLLEEIWQDDSWLPAA